MSRAIRHARRLAVTAVATAALTVGLATSAQATEINSWTGSANECGFVGFSTYGDVFRFLDVCTDGKGVRLQATVPTTASGTPHTSDPKWTKDYTGGNTGFDWADAPVYNADFTEGACFYMRAGLEDGGTYVKDSYGGWVLACA